MIVFQFSLNLICISLGIGVFSHIFSIEKITKETGPGYFFGKVASSLMFFIGIIGAIMTLIDYAKV